MTKFYIGKSIKYDDFTRLKESTSKCKITKLV